LAPAFEFLIEKKACSRDVSKVLKSIAIGRQRRFFNNFIEID